ncbi:MAG: MFS transporter [Rhodospirillaceae bacterium]|nr:MFS transporter [Rhodospirillaceae bacterium]
MTQNKTDPWPSSFAAWYAVIVLVIAYTFSFADRMILSLLIEPIKKDFSLSDTEISLLHGLAFAIFYTIMGIPIGRLVDTSSRRRIIAAGICIWSIMTAFCGLARGFWELFLARVGVGIGEAALSPAAYSLITDIFRPNKLSRALAVYSAGAFIGAGMAFIIGGAVISIVANTPELTLPIIGTIKSWQLSFFLIGLPGLIVAGLMYTIKEPVRRYTEENKVGNGASDAENISVSDVFLYFKRNWTAYLPHFFGFAFLALQFNGLVAWLPTFLLRVFDVSPGYSGPLIGVSLLIFGTAGIVTGGWLSDWLFAKGHKDATLKTGIIGGLLVAPLTAITPLLGSTSAIYLLLAPLMFFSTFSFGAAAAALQQITPNRMRGVMSALYLFCLNLIGLGFGPTAVALATDYIFKSETAVGQSISIVTASAAIIGVAILIMGRKPFRKRVF